MTYYPRFSISADPMPSARPEWIGLQLTTGLWVSTTFSCSGVGQGFCYGHPGGNTSYRHPDPARNCWARVPGTSEVAPISWGGLGCYVGVLWRKADPHKTKSFW